MNREKKARLVFLLVTEEAKRESSRITLHFDKEKRIETNAVNRKNFGYAALSKIYHELDIHTFLKNRQRHTKEEYDANRIMKLLVFSRLLYPASKKKTYENKDRFFEKMDFSLDDVYRCLSFFAKHKDDLQLWLHKRIKEQYNRNTSLVYYDVTNNYFEIDEADERIIELYRGLWKIEESFKVTKSDYENAAGLCFHTGTH